VRRRPEEDGALERAEHPGPERALAGRLESSLVLASRLGRVGKTLFARFLEKGTERTDGDGRAMATDLAVELDACDHHLCSERRSRTVATQGADPSRAGRFPPLSLRPTPSRAGRSATDRDAG
jgi:hypothetical protein